jgi:hypothetical protein
MRGLKKLLLMMLVLPAFIGATGCQFLAGAATGAAATEAAEEVDDSDE